MRTRSAYLTPLPRILAAAALALPVTALTGCGSSSSGVNGIAAKKPAQILATAKAQALGAATVHVAGSILEEGKPISLNMELVGGMGGMGTLSLGGLEIELIDVDKTVYVKGSAAFYSHFLGSAAARLLPGKWLKSAAAKGPLASLATLANPSDLIDDALADHGPLARIGGATVNGRRAVGISDRASSGALYVASTGTPYPLELRTGPAGSGEIVFDRWNKPVTLEPPRNAINVNQLRNPR
jgi:hypothetical protein